MIEFFGYMLFLLLAPLIVLGILAVLLAKVILIIVVGFFYNLIFGKDWDHF